MVTWGTSAVKADGFSVALPAPKMPDPPGLASVGGARGREAGTVPPRRAEPGEGMAAGWHQRWHQWLPGPSPPCCHRP